MKYFNALLGLVLLTVAVTAETGFYVPKAYYTIDEHGYRSPLIYIDSIPQIFQRARRSAQFNQPNFGFPVNFPAFQFPNPAQGGNFQSVSITSGGEGLGNRFDEGGQPAHTINTFSSNNGHVTQTTHHVDKDGKVTTVSNKGKDNAKKN